MGLSIIAAKKARSGAARWHKVFTRTERELKALVRKFPPLRIHDRCDFACPGVAIFNGSEIQRCDECKRFPSDDEAIDFVQVTLSADDTKTEKPRLILLTQRVAETLKKLPRRLGCDFVFPNPKTKQPWNECRKVFQRACTKAGLAGLWFHDLRRSFVTNARRRGVPESVVMKMSGHKTRAVFDRYNIVDEEDLRAAVKKIEAGIALDLGHVLDTAGKDEPQKV